VATYVIPAVAHLPGAGGTLWRTDVAAVNLGEDTATITFTFLSACGDPAATETLAAGGTTEWPNVLETVFDQPADSQSSGSLVVTSDVPLTVTSRTYNQTAEGTFGQYCPALTEGHALAPGDTGYLPLVKSSEDYRTNVGMVNLGEEECTVAVRLFGSDGTQLGSATNLAAGARRWHQQNDVFAAAGAGSTDVAYATVERGGQCGRRGVGLRLGGGQRHRRPDHGAGPGGQREVAQCLDQGHCNAPRGDLHRRRHRQGRSDVARSSARSSRCVTGKPPPGGAPPACRGLRCLAQGAARGRAMAGPGHEAGARHPR